MQLYQLLTFILDNCRIALFDLEGTTVYEADKKSAIPINFYEYYIFEVTTAILPGSNSPAICIMLQK